MAKLLNFSEFSINEGLVPGGWPSGWKSMPEWRTLQDLGFADATTPLQARNETIMLKNERIPIYPEGVVLQKSGYIRNKGVTSGYIKDLREKSYSLKFMFDYLIKVYSDWLLARTRDEKHGELSDEAIRFVAGCTKTKNWKWNPATQSIDVDGSIRITQEQLEYSGPGILAEIKFGKVKGNFDCSNREEITDLSFCPDFVGGDFACRGTSITNLVGAPRIVKGEFDARRNDGLVSLEGLPEKVGGGFLVDQFHIKDVSIDSLLGVMDGKAYDVYNSKPYEIPSKFREKAKTMVAPILSEDFLDSYFKENPMDLYFLDDRPDIKKGVLQRTGIRDLSAVGRNLKHGLI